MILDEKGGRHGVYAVSKMIRIHHNGVFADEIEREAEGVDLAGINVLEGSSVKRVTEEYL